MVAVRMIGCSKSSGFAIITRHSPCLSASIFQPLHLVLSMSSTLWQSRRAAFAPSNSPPVSQTMFNAFPVGPQRTDAQLCSSPRPQLLIHAKLCMLDSQQINKSSYGCEPRQDQRQQMTAAAARRGTKSEAVAVSSSPVARHGDHHSLGARCHSAIE